MSIHIYNSLTRRKEEFIPLKPEQIKMYVCGPTVYDEPHIGHARSAYIFDVIRRYLAYRGYSVKFVRNVTDVDDKIIDKARKEYAGQGLNISFKKVADKYLAQYHEALNKLEIDSEGIIEPKASEYIEKMVSFIKDLINKGVAYPSGGDVYFDITKAKNYGKLSHQSLEKMEVGARVAPGEKKKNPLDFALWKSAKEDEPSWDSPWQKGRPGWHIECSVMSSDILGDEFDIHGGGLDLIFPHHENEIAQSEGAGKKFARYWIHHGLLTINGQKMSKSLGNFVTVNDALKDYPESAAADILKVLFLQTHYSMPLNFSQQKMDEAKVTVFNLLKVLKVTSNLTDLTKLTPKEKDNIDYFKEKFEKAMNNDFNTPQAFAAICELEKHYNNLLGEYNDGEVLVLKYAIQYARDSILELGKILGLTLNTDKFDVQDSKWLDRELLGAVHEEFPRIKEEIIENEREWIQNKVDQRTQLKKEKKYSEADKIRKELEQKGIILEDAKDGKTTWRRKI